MSATPTAIALILFGGGWGAEGTQASIETHVIALKSALANKDVRVLFASGDPTVRDVQIGADHENEASALLGLVFDRRDHLHVAYRSSKVEGAHAASKKSVIEAIKATADNKLGTIVFGVGHGSPATKEEPAAIELFGPDDTLAVDDLAKALDGAPRKAPLAFVLGHCHSGAFTDLAFVSGDPKSRATDPVRCVLAAVPRDRQAAGCSPDADDPEAKAYLALIAEALAKNPKATLADAHAYARINDRTVDVPVSTSEMWIEHALGKKAPAAKTIALDKLLTGARATERAVLTELKPTPKSTPKSAAEELEALNKTMNAIDDEIADLNADYDRIRGDLLDDLLLHFPELANPYHEESRRLMAGNAEELVAFLKSKRELLELDARNGDVQGKEMERFELEKKAAKLERWLRAAVIVAGEDALRRSGAKAAIKTLDKLIACESLAP